MKRLKPVGIMKKLYKTIEKKHQHEKKEEIWLSPVTKAHTPTEKSKKQHDNLKTLPKISITQRLRTDLGRLAE